MGADVGARVALLGGVLSLIGGVDQARLAITT
jgi:hypothetical protein